MLIVCQIVTVIKIEHVLTNLSLTIKVSNIDRIN